MQVIAMARPSCREKFVHLARAATETGPVSALVAVLNLPVGEIVGADWYGGRRSAGPWSTQVPMTCVLAPRGDLPASLHTWSVSGTPVRFVQRRGHVVGAVFEDAFATWCRIGGLVPTDVTAPADCQARDVLEGLEAALQECGMAFRDVARTWFYNDRILSWYDQFNRVRTRFFQERGVFEGLLPASTGIGAANPAGAALTAGLLAIRPRDERVKVQSVASPLQGPAGAYGSSFSRAVEISMPDHRRLYVSGTASIDEGGQTLHPDDPEPQVARTMEVVAALLGSKGMGWADVTRAVAYFPADGDVCAFHRYLAAHDLGRLPVAVVGGDVCRPDLRFEIEVDAVRLDAGVPDV